MSNLRLLNETIITASTSIVDVTDVFTADYDIYKITTNDISTVGTTATALDMRFLNVSGTRITNNKYDYAYLNMKASSSFAEIKAIDQTFVDNFFGVADQSPESVSSVTYVFNPFATQYTAVINQSSRNDTNYKAQKYIAILKQDRQMGGFRLFETNSRPFDSGVIRTYGLRVDS